MASSYSNLKIQLMGTGDNSGTWGTITNTNLGTAIEEAICESADVAFSQASLTLSLTDSNATQVARHLRLNLTGTGSAGITLTVPDIEKNYIINNTLATDVGIKNSSGSQVTVPNGRSAIVYSTGSGVVDAITSLNTAEITQLTVTGDTDVTNLSANGTLDVSGNGSVGGTFNVEGDLKNASGNLTVDPATQIVEIKGNGSDTEGQIKLNCHANSHGQTLKAQPHSLNITNTNLLPKGGNSTLVSESASATITNKIFNASLREKINVSTTSATGVINFSVLEQNAELRTNDAAADFELNFRGSAGATFASIMPTGESVSLAFESKMGATAYYLEAIQIDGATANPVFWQGGSAPSQGNVSGIDSYLINITRTTGTANYTCLASQTQFGKVDY
jgi:hypothetical protein